MYNNFSQLLSKMAISVDSICKFSASRVKRDAKAVWGSMDSPFNLNLAPSHHTSHVQIWSQSQVQPGSPMLCTRKVTM